MDGDAATPSMRATSKRVTAPTSIRCSSRSRARGEFRRVLRLAFRSADRARAKSRVIIAGRNFTPAASGFRWTHRKRGSIRNCAIIISAISTPTGFVHDGPDLELQPRQSGEPVNFLIYPNVEVDGKPLPKEQIKNQFDYTAVAGR